MVISVSVGQPRDLTLNGVTVRTGIVKTPVSGRRWVSSTQIEGDGQADLTVHGGPEKAVYAYPSEHYPAWARELERDDLAWGAFGENLTTRDLLETAVCIGDRFRVGSTVLVVSQPRMPCVKLAMKFGRFDMVRRFTRVDRSGFYLAVEVEGELGAGDAVELLSRDQRGLTVAAVYRLKVDGGTREAFEYAASHPALSTGWRDSFRRRLEDAGT